MQTNGRDQSTTQHDSQDWEWVEETEYIVLDFGGSNFNSNDMESLSKQGYSLIGLETGTPYFKCGIHTFKGCLEENAFTEDLVFNMKVNEDMDEGVEDNEEDNTDALDLVAIATKRVIFDPVELVLKDKNTDVELQQPNSAMDPEPLSEPIDPKTHQGGSTQSIWKAARQAAGMVSTTKRNRLVGTKAANKSSVDIANDESGSTTKIRSGASESVSAEADDNTPMELD
ncbi:hypothetical protein FBU30_007388 [Linnemannia zychae]|nr:hypothetical protein FBU30_007388 [Linnemannia zychae]